MASKQVMKSVITATQMLETVVLPIALLSKQAGSAQEEAQQLQTHAPFVPLVITRIQLQTLKTVSQCEEMALKREQRNVTMGTQMLTTAEQPTAPQLSLPGSV
jgi:hypothetical protein